MSDSPTANVVIVGCGAMGSIYAALLADAGASVSVLSRNADHSAAISERGLRVTGASGDRTVAIDVLDEAPTRAFDLLVVAVKAADVASAAGQCAAAVGPQTLVLGLQNGIGSGDQLADAFDEEQVLLGIAGGFGAEMIEPGHVHHAGMQVLRFGALTSDSASLACARLSEVVGLWRSAGFAVEAADDIVAMQWEKLICNVAFSATCALSGMTVGAALADEHLGPICLAAAQEAFDVARAAGVAITVSDAEAHVRQFAANVAGARPSLLQDLEAGRRTEIDVINGAVARVARQQGLRAPVNETLTALVRQRETQNA